MSAVTYTTAGLCFRVRVVMPVGMDLSNATHGVKALGLGGESSVTGTTIAETTDDLLCTFDDGLFTAGSWEVQTSVTPDGLPTQIVDAFILTVKPGA